MHQNNTERKILHSLKGEMLLGFGSDLSIAYIILIPNLALFVTRNCCLKCRRDSMTTSRYVRKERRKKYDAFPENDSLT